MSTTLDTILEELEEALGQERQALIQFDAAAVEAAAGRKAEIADRLQQCLDCAPVKDAPVVFRTLARIRWTAEANRALLNDASNLLSSVRAMPSNNHGTYDRRARVSSGMAR